MPKAHYMQNNFNAGQLSALVQSRADIDQYKNGVAELTNFIPVIQGGLQRRPGSRFVNEVKDSSKATRLLEFEFSTLESYILEVGDQYFRIYRNNAIIATGAFADEFSAEFEAETPVSVTTPYLEADIFELKWAQSADVLYITHPDYAPRKITRTSNINWSIDTLDFQDGPYAAVNLTTTTLTLSGTSGSVTVTASAATGINNDEGFKSTDVGRLIRWLDPANEWTWLEITGFTSTTQVTATIQGQNPSAGTATADWRLGIWSDTTGYPECVTFFEDRLYFGGGADTPQRLDGSVIGNYESFEPSDPDGTVTADKGVAFTLSANNVNAIRWIIDDEKGLVAGTVGGEWVIRSDQQTDAISAQNPPQARRPTTYGSANQMPVRAGKAVLFVQRSKQKVRELAYVFEDDGFRAPDMTMLADDITLGGIIEMAFQQEPQPIIWMVRADGTLLGFSYDRAQGVTGWHKHVLGGTSDAAGTQAQVESVASIPSADGFSDELWMVVKRYVNGQTVRYVEYLTPIWRDGNTLTADALFLDSNLTYLGDATTTLLDAFHLEGETIGLLVNGAVHSDKPVSSGAISLDRSATNAVVGYNYTSTMKTLRIESAAGDGPAQSKQKRINEVIFRFWQTVGFEISPECNDTYEPLIFREGGANMDTAVPLFTGDKPIDWGAEYGREGQICVRQTQPLPCNLLMYVARVMTQDR